MAKRAVIKDSLNSANHNNPKWHSGDNAVPDGEILGCPVRSKRELAQYGAPFQNFFRELFVFFWVTNVYAGS
jgi:hypothetical protein